MFYKFDQFLHKCTSLREEGISFVIATIIQTKNSTPQDAGVKMIISEKGLEFGTVGGGAIEFQTIKMAQEHLLNKEELLMVHSYNLNKDLKMTCGGELSIVFEKVLAQAPWQIVIFGAGHVAQALISTLLNLECNILCIDTREDWLKKLPVSTKLQTKLVKDYAEPIAGLSRDSFIIIMTSSHALDLPILREALLQKCFPYIGVIGAHSKRKALDIKLNDLTCEKDFFCPIGEAIGSNEPHEIAISIISQLLKHRNKKEENV